MNVQDFVAHLTPPPIASYTAEPRWVPPEPQSECPECGGSGFHMVGYWMADQCDRCRCRPECWGDPL